MDNKAVDKKINDTFWGLFLGMMGGVLLTVLLSMSAHCATSAPKRGDNSLGVVVSQDNPYMYNMGAVRRGVIMNYGDRDFTSIEFAPVGGRLIFPENILFCGNHEQELYDLAQAHKVIVLMYERESHLQLQGIGCHELVGVYEVKGQ